MADETVRMDGGEEEDKPQYFMAKSNPQGPIDGKGSLLQILQRIYHSGRNLIMLTVPRSGCSEPVSFFPDYETRIPHSNHWWQWESATLSRYLRLARHSPRGCRHQKVVFVSRYIFTQGV